MKMIAAAYEQGGTRIVRSSGTSDSSPMLSSTISGTSPWRSKRVSLRSPDAIRSAATLYEQLVSEVEDEPAGQEVYAVSPRRGTSLDQFERLGHRTLPAAARLRRLRRVAAEDEMPADDPEGEGQ